MGKLGHHGLYTKHSIFCLIFLKFDHWYWSAINFFFITYYTCANKLPAFLFVLIHPCSLSELALLLYYWSVYIFFVTHNKLEMHWVVIHTNFHAFGIIIWVLESVLYSNVEANLCTLLLLRQIHWIPTNLQLGWLMDL